MSLSTLLKRDIVTAAPMDSLVQVAALMERKKVGAVVITEGTRPVGIVTDRDLALAVCGHGVSTRERVQNVMTCPVATIRDDEGVFNATQKMMDNAVRRLPVVDEHGILVGLVAIDDLLLLLSRELQSMAEGIKAETVAV